MKKLITIILFSASLTSCSGFSGSDLNYISLGMSKRELIDEIGTPKSTRASGGLEYLIYEEIDCPIKTKMCLYRENYFVKLAYGKVESYGKVGDFNSTKNKTVNQNVKQEIIIRNKN